MTYKIQISVCVDNTPWHNLGIQITSKQSLETLAAQTNMAFDILETPVRYTTIAEDLPIATHSFNKRKVLYRSDTREALSVVSNRYQVIQPKEILAFYLDITESFGFELDIVGIMKRGRKLWALAKTGGSIIIKAKDRVDEYLLLATACDGSLATTAQLTSIRATCHSTLPIALSGEKVRATVSHSTIFYPDRIKMDLDVSTHAWSSFRYRVTKLAERKLKEREADDFLLALLAVPGRGDGHRSITRTVQQIKRIYTDGCHVLGRSFIDGTAFDLLYAVTKFVDQERDAKSIDHRLDSAWFGQGAALKAKALWMTTTLLD